MRASGELLLAAHAMIMAWPKGVKRSPCGAVQWQPRAVSADGRGLLEASWSVRPDLLPDTTLYGWAGALFAENECIVHKCMG